LRNGGKQCEFKAGQDERGRQSASDEERDDRSGDCARAARDRGDGAQSNAAREQRDREKRR